MLSGFCKRFRKLRPGQNHLVGKNKSSVCFADSVITLKNCYQLIKPLSTIIQYQFHRIRQIPRDLPVRPFCFCFMWIQIQSPKPNPCSCMFSPQFPTWFQRVFKLILNFDCLRLIVLFPKFPKLFWLKLYELSYPKRYKLNALNSLTKL